MQGNGENKNVEIKGNPKSPWVKIAAAVVVIAVVFFGYRAWKDGSSQPVQQAAAEPVVIVRQVEKFDASSVPSEYVGRVESIQSVSVKPQISGEIAKVCFKEGSVVKAGQLLFQIDPKQYEATVQPHDVSAWCTIRGASPVLVNVKTQLTTGDSSEKVPTSAVVLSNLISACAMA